MDSEDNSKSEPKNKTLPTYVFGEDYRQTINLSNKETSNKDDSQDVTAEPSPDADTQAESHIDVEELHSKEDIDKSINDELEKIELDKIEPISMIVTKKKFRLRFLVAIFFVAAISFGALYGVVFLMEQGIIGGANSKHIVSGLSTKDLICEMEGENSELLTTGNALSLKSSAKISYINDDFSEILQTIEAQFENSSTAKIAMSNIRSNYVKRFKSFGVATEPFKSEYNQNDSSITVTHYADTSMISSDNAGVLHIDVNKNGVVVYDIESIKKNYEDIGYACRIE